MILASAERCLTAIRDSMRGILSGNASQVLEEAIAEARVSSEQSQLDRRRKKKNPRHWGYSVRPERPLEFRECEVGGYRATVDLYCSFRWPPESSLPASEQNVTFRIWSLDDSLSFRDQWDSEHVRQTITRTNRRVISRFHFDLANAGQPGPRYHFQSGGVAHVNECCWIPEAADIPRIAHPPVDLVLTCQMIAANFFPERYREIRANPSWWAAVREAQNYFCADYYNFCHRTLTDRNAQRSLLDQLWNVQ
jgi:hypothetical protein